MQRLDRFGNFLILAELGSDAAGSCYRAAIFDGSRVAKLAHLRVVSQAFASDTAVAGNLRKAVLIGSQFDHLNVSRAETVGAVGDDLFLARDYAGGTTLLDLMAKCRKEMYPLGVDHALFVLSSVMSALDYLHGKKIEGRRVTHQGLCSATVGISFEGEVRLTDWELFEALPPSTQKELLGPLWAQRAPELRAGKELGPRSNIYSVGVMLYEMLARRPIPADAPDAAALVSALNLKSAFATPSAADRVKDVLKRCLAPDPAQRFEDVREVKAALDEVTAAEGIEASAFNFAFFMHTLYRIESEEEAEQLDAERGMKAPLREPPHEHPSPNAGPEGEEEEVAPDRADTDELTVLSGTTEELGAIPEDEGTVLGAREMVAAFHEAPVLSSAVAPAVVQAAAPVEVAERTVLKPAPAIALKPAPPPPLVEVKPTRPAALRPPVIPDLGDEVPSARVEPPRPAVAAKGGGGKAIVLAGVALLVLLVAIVGIVVFMGRKAETANPAAGLPAVPKEAPAASAPAPQTTTTAPEVVPAAPTAPGAAPIAPAPGKTTAATPATTGVPPPTPEASPEELKKKELQSATGEAKRLAGANKFDEALAALDAMAQRYPDMSGPLGPLRDEIQGKKDEFDKKQADAKAKAEADTKAKADAEARSKAEALEREVKAVEDLIAAGRLDEAITKLDGNPEIASGPGGSELRGKIEAARKPVPSVKEGDLVDASSGGVVAPRMMTKAEPKYPPLARSRKVSGSVLIEALVGEDGRVVETKVKSVTTTPSGNWGLDKAAEEAARKCEFAPATKEGVKVKMWTTIPFNFRAE